MQRKDVIYNQRQRLVRQGCTDPVGLGMDSCSHLVSTAVLAGILVVCRPMSTNG